MKSSGPINAGMMEGRALYEPDHELYRAQVRRFFDTEVVPNIAAWEKAGITPREAWLKAAVLDPLNASIRKDRDAYEKRRATRPK